MSDDEKEKRQRARKLFTSIALDEPLDAFPDPTPAPTVPTPSPVGPRPGPNDNPFPDMPLPMLREKPLN